MNPVIRLLVVVLLFNTYTVWGQTCKTTIADTDRVDCNVRPITQAACEAVGCVWCPNVAVKIAKCFVNNTDPLGGKSDLKIVFSRL